MSPKELNERDAKHLTETRGHKRQVASRIKKLGGSPDAGGVTGVVSKAAGKGVAAVKGQVGTVRAAVTEQPETHLRNAQEELREEHVEIALYTRIEMFATEVGDKDTARLAAAIKRDEVRMAKFLDAELVRLVKDVVRVRAEVPRDQRQNGGRTRSRRRTTSRSASGSGSRSASASRSRSTTGPRRAAASASR